MRFENGIAKQTTKFEHRILNYLKYGIMDGLDIQFEKLPDDIAYWYLEELYKEAYFKDSTLKDVEIYKDEVFNTWYIKYFDTLTNQWSDNPITMIPSNLETLICAYRMVGKYRKVAMLKHRYPNKMRAARV